MGKYILVCKEYISPFRLIIYVLCSSTHTFSTFYIKLFFTHTAEWVNLLSSLQVMCMSEGFSPFALILCPPSCVVMEHLAREITCDTIHIICIDARFGSIVQDCAGPKASVHLT